MDCLIRTYLPKQGRFASFGPIVNSSREEAADGSSTHCRAEGAAVHSSVKRKRKKTGDFFILNHFLNTVSLFDSCRSRG